MGKKFHVVVMGIMTEASVLALSLLVLLSPFCYEFCYGVTDTITSNHFIIDDEIIVSSKRVFKLGFFSPEGSTNRYVGIWYNTTSLFTIIRVANRDQRQRPCRDGTSFNFNSDIHED